MESFLKELYENDEAKAEESMIHLEEKKHNLPDICIEIDMQKLQFRHSIYGPKIFEICGKTSIYNKYITRLSFIGWDVPALYMAKVFPNCVSQMSHVKEVSIKLHKVKFPDSCMNLSKCYNIEKLNLDFGLSNYQTF